jgi:hypothetical protein
MSDVGQHGEPPRQSPFSSFGSESHLECAAANAQAVSHQRSSNMING